MFVYSKFGGHPFSHLEMSKTMMWELNQRKKKNDEKENGVGEEGNKDDYI